MCDCSGTNIYQEWYTFYIPVKKFVQNWAPLIGFFTGCLALSPYFLVFFPGTMNADSFLTYQEALDSHFGNWFPVTYSILLNTLLKIWHHPASMILFQLIAIAAAVSFLVSKLTTNTKARVLVPLAFLIWPQAGATTVLLSRDVFFCAVFLVISGYLLDWFADPTHPHPVALSLCLFFLIILRWNGVIIGIPVIILICVLAKNFRHAVLPIIGLVLGIIILIFPPLSADEGGSAMRTGGKAIDIAWALKVDTDSFSKSEITLIETLGGVELWSQSQRNCMNVAMPLLYDVFDRGKLWGTLGRRSVSTEINNVWLKHMTRSFDVFIGGRLCRMHGLFLLKSGFPQSPVVSYNFNNNGSATDSNAWLVRLGEQQIKSILGSSQVDVAGNYLNNYGKSLFGRFLANPLPFLALTVLRMCRRKSFTQRDRLLVALPMLVIFSIFIGGAGYEPRYVWPATALSALALLTDISQLSYRKPQSQSS